MKNNIFAGPQIWQMLGFKKLKQKMALERDASQLYCNIVNGF